MIHAAQKFNAAPKFPFTLQAVLAMVGLVASLGLGACGRSADITDPLARPGRARRSAGCGARPRPAPWVPAPAPKTPLPRGGARGARARGGLPSGSVMSAE